MFRRRTGAGNRGGLGVLLLALQLFNVGFDNIPVVTLSSILLQAGIFLKLFDGFLPRVPGACVSVLNVWDYWQWKRLAYAAVVHADDMHLYFNMISFLWKGKSLEPKLGSKYFAYLLIVFSILTNVVLLLLNFAFANYLEWPGYYQQCAVGFSGLYCYLSRLNKSTIITLPFGMPMS